MEEDEMEISKLFNKILKANNNLKYPDIRVYQDVLNLLLIFDDVRYANPISASNFGIITKIADFLNDYIDEEDDKIVLVNHYDSNNLTVTKQRNEENVDEILKLFLNENKKEAHSLYGEILGYYCYNQNWMNRDICRVQMQIQNEKGIQITTEVCEFDIFKEYYEDHLEHFITKLDNWIDTMNKYRINCELNGIITFWIVYDCKDIVDDFINENVIQNLGLTVKTKITDGKKKKRNLRF